MSTSLVLIELVEEITTSLDNQESALGVFIDLKKTFDTVDHMASSLTSFIIMVFVA